MAEIITMPKLGFDMAEGTLVRWVIAEGEDVTKGAVLAEIETDKATVEVESTASGVLLRQLVEQGSVVPVNTPIAIIGQPGESIQSDTKKEISAEAVPAAGSEKEQEAQPSQKPSPAIEMQTTAKELRASPLARRLAREAGIDLGQIKGSGPQGRITKVDVESYLAFKGRMASETVAPALVSEPVSPAAFTPGLDQHIPLTKLRSIIGKRMVQSVQNVPHFFVTHEVDVENLIALRKDINNLLPEGEKISVNDFIVRAVALSLKEFPNLNASIDEEKGEIIQHGSIHVGVAVALENGLITVVCKYTDQKSIRQISSEIRALVDRARQGKVRSEDIEGSTFSISNLGMFDVTHFTAIINPPEAAILAVGSVTPKAVVVDGEIQIRQRMNVTISVDHRISDGAEAARFLQVLAKYLEEPLRLMV